MPRCSQCPVFNLENFRKAINKNERGKEGKKKTRERKGSHIRIEVFLKCITFLMAKHFLPLKQEITQESSYRICQTLNLEIIKQLKKPGDFVYIIG